MDACPCSRTLSVFIACKPDAVTNFVSSPINLPRWATAFCHAVRSEGGNWLAETPQGLIKIRFAPPNEFGVLDHYVLLPSGQEVYAPMRAIANGAGTEVLFTLLRLPGMSARQFDEDAGMVQRDLQTLKAVMENSTGLPAGAGGPD